MRKITHIASGLAAAVMLAMAPGCEQTDGDGTRFLNIDPAQATLGTNIFWMTVAVRQDANVRDLSLPLTWNVSNTNVGRILEPTAGYSAVYLRLESNGVNTISVQDQYGAAGYAYVNQVNYFTVEPSNSVSIDTNSVSTNAVAALWR